MAVSAKSVSLHSDEISYIDILDERSKPHVEVLNLRRCQNLLGLTNPLWSTSDLCRDAEKLYSEGLLRSPHGRVRKVLIPQKNIFT